MAISATTNAGLTGCIRDAGPRSGGGLLLLGHGNWLGLLDEHALRRRRG